MAPLGLAHMLSTQEIIKCQLFIFKIDYKAGLLLTPMLVYQSNFFVPSTVPLPSVLGQFFPPPFFFFLQIIYVCFQRIFFHPPPPPRPLCTACGILVPQIGIEPRTPAMETWSLNRWTPREVLCLGTFEPSWTYLFTQTLYLFSHQVLLTFL